MRHIGTLIAAIIIGPLAWILLAFGQNRSAEAFADAQGASGLHTGDFVRPLQYLAAAGLLLGLIATLRFSPLGAAFVGAGYASSYALLLVAPEQVLDVIGDDLSVAGRHADPTMPIRTGTTLVLGILLLVGVVSIGRWRRWPRPDDTVAGTLEEQRRPLGADGLGLLPPHRDSEPEPAAPFASRPSRRQPAGSGMSSWAGSSWAGRPWDGRENA